ncbi:MAG TPA: tyrosine-type recombinase/integrase [Patescibacteria group bacterium]|nr:tyrosine-type recombinase/integrase [Patescibacteria group bacterium]
MKIDEKDFLSFITIKKNLANQSVRHCRIRLRVIVKWLDGRELTKQLVEQFFMELKNKGQRNNSLNTYYFVFRQILDYFRDRGIQVDFLDGFSSFKKEKPDIVILSIEEIEKLINTSLTYGKLQGKDCTFLNIRYGILTMFIAYTGCRFSEASKLKIKNLDLSEGKATFIDTKTNENRTVYFTDPLITNLKELILGRKIDDLVFRNSQENEINPQDFSTDIKRRAKKAGIIKRMYPHVLRHSYITHMLEAGVPITEVATLVGHKDIQTTYSTYMHLADQTLRKASMRNPLIIKNVNPVEILKSIREAIENFHVDNDSRFFYDFRDKGNEIEFKLLVK